jgi:tetratricopeptide (TPR) repeat protein/tRNA A-37 threonylcarbamoyl transferase component Bud32
MGGDATADLPPSQRDAEATSAFDGGVPGLTRRRADDKTSPADVTGAYTPGAAPTTRPVCAPRMRADRYALKKFHAKGGMGEIWLAEDCDLGRAVALKRMRRQGSVMEQERFLREARITGQLEHPGIVPVHELGSDDKGQPVYVMKFVHGRTMTDAIKEYHKDDPNPDTPCEVQLVRLLQEFIALCQTVAYAHSRGVLHRDIKPDNVMLGPYGETLVLDWGLAKLMGQSDGQGGGVSLPLSASGESMESVAGSVRGTPGYMPPEMAGGEIEAIDQRSDVYLLGATLYQILTGRQPRRGKALPDVLKEAMSSPPAAPRALDPSIPKALEAVCLKAMAFVKGDRYATAEALADDVQRYLAGEPVAAYREGTWERARRWIKRHRRAVARGLGGVVALAAGLGMYFAVHASLEQKEAERREAADKAEKLRLQEQTRATLADFNRLSEEARYYLANANVKAEQTLYFEPRKAAAVGRAALEVADRLTILPLTDEEQKHVKEQEYELLLLLAQDREASAEAARGALDLLARAENLRVASPSLHRVRAECYRQLGDGREDEERRRAAAGEMSATALDHFLIGDHYRAEAERQPVGRADAVRDLLLKALSEYRQALRLESDHFWARYQLAYALRKLGKEAQSEEALGACVALRPKSPWGYVARGLLLANLKRYSEAEADFAQALALDPDQVAARLHRAFAASQQDDAEKEKFALSEFTDLLAKQPKKPLIEAAYYRGRLHMKHKRHEDALRDFDFVALKQSDFADVQWYRAILHFRTGQEDKAVEDLNAHLASGKSFDPNSAAAYAERGRLLMQLAPNVPPEKREAAFTRALTELRKASDLGEQSAEFLNDYASLLDGLEQYGLAIEKYSAALAKKPNDAKLLTKRGWAYVNSEKLIEGEADFQAVLRRDATDKEAHSGLGYVKALRGPAGPALREAQWATLYGGGDYGILHNVACIYAALARSDAVRRKDYEGLAIDALRRALELWKRGDKTEPNEEDLIRGESAFRDLRKLSEFKELVPEEKP